MSKALELAKFGRETIPTGEVVGDSDTQSLSNKTLVAPVLSGTVTAGGGVGTNGQVLTSSGAGVSWTTVSGGSGGITTGKSIAMAIVFGG
jgi:hypothetical protein